MTATIDESRVRAKVASRELCEQILLLVAGEHRALVEAHGQVASEAFWENFRQAFEGHFPKPEAPAQNTPKPMDAFEAAQFGKRTLPFGIHKGKTIDARLSRMVGLQRRRRPEDGATEVSSQREIAARTR